MYSEDPDNLELDSDFNVQQHSTRSGTSYAKNRQAQYSARDWVEENKDTPVQKWSKQIMPHSNFKAPKWVKASGMSAVASSSNQQINNSDVLQDDDNFV